MELQSVVFFSPKRSRTDCVDVAITESYPDKKPAFNEQLIESVIGKQTGDIVDIRTLFFCDAEGSSQNGHSSPTPAVLAVFYSFHSLSVPLLGVVTDRLLI